MEGTMKDTLEIEVKKGPGICNDCGEVVTHLAVFIGENNHPTERGTYCFICNKNDKILAIDE